MNAPCRLRFWIAAFVVASLVGTSSRGQEAKPAEQQQLPPGRISGPSDEVAEICIAGRGLRNEGKYDEAIVEFEKALKTARFTKDRPGEAWSISNIATVYRYRADKEADKATELIQKSAALYEQAANIARESADKHNEAYATLYLGALAAMKGDTVEAQRRYDVAMPLFRAVNDRYYVGRTYAFQARAALLQKQPQKAIELFEKAVPLLREVGMFNEVRDVDAEIKAVKAELKP